MEDEPIRFSFGPTSTQKLQFLCFYYFSICFFRFCFFSFFGPLAGNVVLCQCHSIAHVLALYFLVKADLSDMTRQDKKDPGQKGSRTKGIKDKMEPGQKGARTIRIQDNQDPGQSGSRTIRIKDNLDQGHKGSRRIRNQDNKDPGQ